MDHFKDLFYFNKSKIDQDKFILKYLVIKNPSKVTTTVIDRKIKRSITITYLVRMKIERTLRFVPAHLEVF